MKLEKRYYKLKLESRQDISYFFKGYKSGYVFDNNYGKSISSIRVDGKGMFDILYNKLGCPKNVIRFLLYQSTV